MFLKINLTKMIPSHTHTHTHTYTHSGRGEDHFGWKSLRHLFRGTFWLEIAKESNWWKLSISNKKFDYRSKTPNYAQKVMLARKTVKSQFFCKILIKCHTEDNCDSLVILNQNCHHNTFLSDFFIKYVC